MLLAINTGIPFEVWRDGDQAALRTALDLMEQTPSTTDSEGRQMKG